MTIKDDTIVILQARMAGWLMFNRFNKLSEKVDLKDNSRNIYVFRDTPEIRAAMNMYNQYKNMVL
jgi:DNA-binding transcriptional regulator of glucitol operon